MLKKIIVIGFLAAICNIGNSYKFDRNFDDYTFLLKFYGSFGLGSPSGPIMDQERNSWTLSELYQDGTILTSTPYPYALTGGVSGEILLGDIGVVFAYNPINITENVSVGDGNTYQNYTYGGTLISGNAFYGGLNYHVPFNLRKWCGSFYFGVKAGVLTGTLNPYVSFYNFLGVTQPGIGLTGYSICPNIGFNFMFDAFLLGFSVNYYMDYFTAAQNLDNYYDYSGYNFNVDYPAVDVYIGLAF